MLVFMVTKGEMYETYKSQYIFGLDEFVSVTYGHGVMVTASSAVVEIIHVSKQGTARHLIVSSFQTTKTGDMVWIIEKDHST